jgi:Family of unknown function (DUF6459)
MTATLSAPSSTSCFVRIRRAPTVEPPTDEDRRRDEHPVCAGQLALFSSVQSARAGTATAVPEGGGGQRGVRTPASAPAPGPSPHVAGNPVAAQIAAGRFVSACVEVLNGFRPVGHLRALTTPFDYAAVVKQLTKRARLRLPAAPAGSSAAGSRVGLHRVRVFEQRAGVAEAVAVLRHGNVTWAIALRFEHRRGAWLCNLLEVV